MDFSLPGSSGHEILQARILEWIAISFSRGSSQPRDWTHVSYVSCIGRQILHHCHPGSPPTPAVTYSAPSTLASSLLLEHAKNLLLVWVLARNTSQRAHSPLITSFGSLRKSHLLWPPKLSLQPPAQLHTRHLPPPDIFYVSVIPCFFVCLLLKDTGFVSVLCTATSSMPGIVPGT